MRFLRKLWKILPGFLLLIVKCERHKLKKILLNKIETGLDDFENSASLDNKNAKNKMLKVK